jgi:Holliday junction resolvase RusA-like endonuclease
MAEYECKQKAERFIRPSQPIQFFTAVGKHLDYCRIVIPCLPPSKNVWFNKHWATQRTMWFNPWKRWLRDEYMHHLAFYHWQPKMRGECDVVVTFHLPNKRRRDLQNLFSFPPLFDVLVECGIIDDDSEAVAHPRMAEPVYDKTAQTVIEITRRTP